MRLTKPVFVLVIVTATLLMSLGGALANHTDMPTLVVIPGTLQSALGCPGDWQPDCEATALTYSEGEDIWRGTFTLPAGDYEYKVALNGSWTENYGGNGDQDGPDVVLSLAEETTVNFYYDHKTHWVADSVGDVIVTAPGSYQSEIGCPAEMEVQGDWAPMCMRSWMQDPDGDGIYSFTTTAIPAGDYQVKAAINESWSENYGADGASGGADIPFSVPADGAEVTFAFNSTSNLLVIGVGEVPDAGPVMRANLGRAQAHWVTADTIAWDVDTTEGNSYALYFSAEGGLELGANGINGGLSIPLTLDPAGLSEDVLAKFPQLTGFAALKIAEEDIAGVPGYLKMQTAVAAVSADGGLIDGTLMQIPGVLDDLYANDAPLGVNFTDGVPTLSVWAPTARRVSVVLFDSSAADAESESFRMVSDPETGVWSYTGEADWYGRYYVYQVEVYVPSTGAVERNRVTDPYSVSLSMNSTRSQIIDLNDPSLIPEGWEDLVKPELAAPEDTVIYEMHIRDFSVNDESVPEDLRGTFSAFTVADSNGMNHLRGLADAGLSHLHLLPSFDIATINEDPSQRTEIPFEDLAGLAPDSEEQQAALDPIRDQDAFNWGYDPYHFNTPEGSYSTDPDGAQRVLEFRQMVQALNQAGLRVVVDVVYNHTNGSGQSNTAVFDRIVPGYYHRLNDNGQVETSTCCQNTATEHAMMERFMVDSVRLWASAYRVDGFRFDLMGHHMRENMEAVRAALDEIDPTIYVYGEGWNFGEVANDARGVNATQINMGGTGIGTFNDRLRDAVRGGSPFGGRNEQGFVSDLWTNPNATTPGTPEEQRARLLLFADQIRVGMAGNLRDYTFVDALGNTVTGADISYNGAPAGYTLDPQENIVYVSKHDNETLWDIILYKGIENITMDERVRMHNLGLNIVLLSQGVPFFQAGDDLLRSKSLDRNSYNSGDWFNRLDFTYQTNNWGVGLPPQGDNSDRWDEMRPLLANPDLVVTPEQIEAAVMNFREYLQIRQSSVLFRLHTAQDVSERLTFLNTGAEQTPGIIVMVLDDTVGDDLDPNAEQIVVVINATGEAISFGDAMFADGGYVLHPVLAASHDAIVQEAAFADGAFSVPGRTAAVFVLPE